VAVALDFPDGPAALLHISWTTAGTPDIPNLEFLGERGTIRLWFDRPYLEITAPLPEGHWSHAARRKLPWRVVERVGPWLPKRRQEQVRVRVTGGDLMANRALVADFVDAIVHGRDAAISGREGLRDLEAVLAAYRSLETGVRNEA
jgi:predicted dehydrogenase